MEGEKRNGNGCGKEPSSLDSRVRLILQVGMLASVGLMLAGLVLYAVSGSSEIKAVGIGEIPSGVMRGQPVAVISLGIILLLATPVLRVVTVIFTMAEYRETFFVLVGLLVISFLMVSFLLATFR